MRVPTIVRNTAIVAIPPILIGLIGLSMSGSLGAQRQVGVEFIEAPDNWVAFEASLSVTHPENFQLGTVGRFYRSSNGSTRRESGPSLTDIRVIDIVNVADSAQYVFSQRTGWVRFPIAGDRSRPLKYRKNVAGWSKAPGRLALKKGQSGVLSAAEGFEAYLVTETSGVTKLRVADLNLFEVATTRPDGLHERYADIDLVEPAAELFRPPAGATVQEQPAHTFDPSDPARRQQHH